MKYILILTIFCLTSISFARDPDALPRDYQYGERQTVGGSGWSGADTFVLCGVAVMAAMVFALPSIFDGESQAWPTYKFRRKLSAHYPRIIRSPLFPTRRLCGSY